MSVFTWRAEVGTSGEGEFALYSSKFGDGYSQDIPLGMNNEFQRFSVVVSGYSAQVQPVFDFIRAQKGQPFQWKAPKTAGLTWWKCRRYSHNDQGGDYTTLTMEFEQAYMP